MQEKQHPPCDEFLIATVRHLRYNRPTLKKGTNAGVGVARVYEVAITFYSDEEIRGALNDLLKEEKIVLLWKIYSVRHYAPNPDGYTGPTHTEIVSHIDAETPIERAWWNKGTNGVFYPPGLTPKGTDYDHVDECLAYVVEDGLPQRASAVVNRKKLVAEEVLRRMREKK